MNRIELMGGFANPVNWMLSAGEYLMDRAQRTVLFWDVLRRRGNNYLAHLKAGQPPALFFPYETVMDGRTFSRPVNYALLRILSRRKIEDRRAHPRETGQVKDRRTTRQAPRCPLEERKRPIVIIDPRAGHGPGIGGSKLDSQIGVALDFGYHVYFIIFFTDPEAGQTITDVKQAEVRFLEEVARLHPKAPKPAVIGNCQAGWAAALIGADRPDVIGPMVLNGSPLSYWGGVDGANTMRYRGGLLGGVWLASLWGDLGNGVFDGANLVAGFEDLNPANTLWTKQYHLFANVDTEAQRYLDFETWWGGFFKMTAEEIHFIVESLFVGNALEEGKLRLDNGNLVNLKNFRTPIFVFASSGDNITPPPQALGWIKKVYGTVDEIKRCGQVIIYMVHANVGHLGIFVSGNVARRQHREIIGCVDMMEYLAPGLYEMVIEGEPSEPWLYDYRVRFEERDMNDLLKIDVGLQNEAAFLPVRAVSAYNDRIYRTFVRPWVRLAVTESSAACLRQLHPLRVQRYTLSDLNPFLWPLKWIAESTQTVRQPVAADNPFLAIEALMSGAIEAGLNYYRDMRDQAQELWFKSIYDNPWMKTILKPSEQVPADTEQPGSPELQGGRLETFKAQRTVKKASFAEAAVRIFVAVVGADRMLDRRQFEAVETIVRADPRLSRFSAARYKAMIKQQALLLRQNPHQALEEVAYLLPDDKDRQDALSIARRINPAGRESNGNDKEILNRIRVILGISE